MSEARFTAEVVGGRIGLSAHDINRYAKRKGVEPFQGVGQGAPNEFTRVQLLEIFQGTRHASAVVAIFSEGDPAAQPASAGVDVETANDDDHMQQLWERFERASDKKKADSNQRAAIARAVDDYQPALGWTRAYEAVAREKNQRLPSVRRWSEAVRGCDRADYPALLLDKHAGRPQQLKYPKIYDERFRDFWLRSTQPAYSVAYDKALSTFPSEIREAAPKLKTLIRRLQREVHPDVILMAREGKEALDRAYPHLTRDRSVFHATQALNADGHRFDFFVRWPDGEICRPMTVAFQDLYSNLFLGWRTDRSENRDAVRLAAGDALKRGIPEHLYFDNGRAFMTKWLTGGMQFRYRFKVKIEDPLGTFEWLGIRVHATHPYRGQGKPIERSFRDLENHMRARPELIDAWCGNAPGARPHDARIKAVDLEVFLRVLDAEILSYNRRDGRRTDIAAGRSFEDTFNASYVKAPIRKATEEQLRRCMLAAERVYVSPQDSTIALFGNRYWSAEAQCHRGEHLAARFDPGDLQNPEEIFLYALNGSFLTRCEVRTVAGFNDAEAAQNHHREKNRYLRATREQSAAQRRMDDIELSQIMPTVETPATAEAQVVRPVRPKIQPPHALPDSRRHDGLMSKLEKLADANEQRVKDAV
jgi:putative transposase